MSINSILIVFGVLLFIITITTGHVLLDENFVNLDSKPLNVIIPIYIVVTESLGLYGVIREHFGINLFSAMLSVLELVVFFGIQHFEAVFDLPITLMMFIFCAMIKKADIVVRDQ